MTPKIIEELRSDAAWLRQDAKHASEVGDDIGWSVADKRADLLDRAATIIEQANGLCAEARFVGRLDVAVPDLETVLSEFTKYESYEVECPGCGDTRARHGAQGCSRFECECTLTVSEINFILATRVSKT
jgi:hypothetical protein